VPSVYEKDLAPGKQRTERIHRIISLVAVEVVPNGLLDDSEYLYFGKSTFIDECRKPALPEYASSDQAMAEEPEARDNARHTPKNRTAPQGSINRQKLGVVAGRCHFAGCF